MPSFDDDYWEFLRDAGVFDEEDDPDSVRRIRAKKKASEKKSGAVKPEIAKKKKKKIAPPFTPTEGKSKSAVIALLKKKNNKHQDVLPCSSNAQIIFTHDLRWSNILAFDEFIGDIVALKVPPWHKDLAPQKLEHGVWTDSDTSRATMWLTREYGISLRPSEAGAALRITAERHHYHPVKMWLESLVHDGKDRLGDWLIRLCGAEDTPYNRAVGKNFLIGAVARAMKPGCQVDSMPVFEGDQGSGKSTMLRILAGSWFLETSIEMGNKDSYQVLRGKWIIEWGEMASMTRSEVNKTKQYVSERTSTYRPSYGTKAIDFQRQCVFAGTCNPEPGGYLKDETGARRFHPVALGRIDLAALKKERKQLFAEAMVAYLAGVPWHFMDPELIEAQKGVAEERRQRHPWEAILYEHLSTLNDAQRETGVTTHELLQDLLRIGPQTLTKRDEMQCATILKLLGWSNMYRPNPSERRYCPKGPEVTPRKKKGSNVVSLDEQRRRKKAPKS